MSKRGLSMNEKKTKMLEIFQETGDFFTIKELEKIGPKAKGVVQQTVKEVVDDLVGDGTVQFDKIGTNFWSFPSAAGATKQAAVAKAYKERYSIIAKIEETARSLEEADDGKEDTAERRRLLSALSDLTSTSKCLNDELAAFRAADPEKYERKTRAVEVGKEAAFRWTDNTMILLQFAASLGFEEAQMRVQLGIGEDWDDLKL